LTVRIATPADAERLSMFARRTFEETFAAQNTPQDMALYLSQAFSNSKQLAEIQDPHTITLIAERDQHLVGYAQLRSSAPPDCVPDAETIELVRFYVDRSLHGTGTAKALMDAVERAAIAQARSIWLGVWERNTRAIAFYQKCGFEDVGTHDFMLGSDRQTDRIMWRVTAKNQ
jgi:diamine N-acetyltransferase